MQFGRSSEQMNEMIGQLETLRAEAPTEPPPPADTGEPPPPRKPLPDHLPGDTQEHLPSACDCPACGGSLKKLGETVSEMLEYVPASFRVIRHVRSKFACSRCDTIVQAPAPSRPIARGLAGAGLLAHVRVAKYCDHLPL